MNHSMIKMAVAVLMLAGCNGGDRYSPTAPRSRSTFTANYFLSLDHDSETVALDVQLLVDDTVLYTGPLHAGSAWDYHVDPLYLSGSLGALAAGRHSLTLRVDRQNASPTRYLVFAKVEVETKQVALWSESVTLETGAAWTGEFVLGDEPGWDY